MFRMIRRVRVDRLLAVSLCLLGFWIPSYVVRAQERVWVELRAPVEEVAIQVPIPLVEVRGVAGAGRSLYYDVALILDLSTSTRLPSGVDVDGDGHIGVSDPEISGQYWGSAAPEKLCDDLGDTIAAAEIQAARRLIKVLDPEHTRVALIAFGDRGQLEAPLGTTPEGLGKALDVLDGKHGWYGGTNYSSALRTALDALMDPAVARPDALRTILFLSDGFPTMPIPPKTRPEAEARAAATAAARVDARIFAFALGPEAIKGKAVLTALAERTNGGLELLERPGDVLFHLPLVELSQIAEIRMENAKGGRPGRAIRLFPDGGFDGFVPLDPGANTLRITAVSVSGATGVAERTVVYEPTHGEGRRLELEVERLRTLLRDRTVEIELNAEIKRERAERRKRLKIEVER